MSVPPCKGRLRVKENDRKWYLEKGKSSMLYTCCEECYNKYIKGTDNESKYVETNACNGANCDYLLYETDCNYTDCSITKGEIRISIINESGRRCKLSPNDNTTFLVKNSDTYSFLLENLTEYQNMETSKIVLETCKINNDDFLLPSLQKCSPFIIEARITKNMMGKVNNWEDENNENNGNDENNEMPELEGHQESESEPEPKSTSEKTNSEKSTNEINANKTSNHTNDSEDELMFVVSKYEQLNVFQISELSQSMPGVFSNGMGMEVMKFDVSQGNKYKAFFCIDTYSCNPNNTVQFSISVKFVNDNDSESNDKESEFDIDI